MRCPVCGKYYEVKIDDCVICGTKNINPMFVNQSDVADWQEGIDLAKNIWFMEENNYLMQHFNKEYRENASKRTLQQLDIYFDYSTLKERIDSVPNDLFTRSWLIDYLVEVYTFPNNYPISSRKYVKEKIEEHLGYMKLLKDSSPKGQFVIECNNAVMSLKQASIELADGNVSQVLAFYYEFLTNPVVKKGVISYKENENYIECEEDIMYVLHNCKQFCKLFDLNLDGVIEKIISNLSGGISNVEEGYIYMHGMDCGIIGPNDSVEARQFLGGYRKNKCTLETCCYEGQILSTKIGNLNIGGESRLLVGYDNSFRKVWSVEYRTLEYDFENTILKDKDNVQKNMDKILALFC